MTTFRTFPDFEAVCGKALRDANITNLGTRVYSSIPKNPTYPLATVRRTGGLPKNRHGLDAANIQIDVWGGSKSEAHDIAQAARKALMDIEGTSYASPVTAYVNGVEDNLGLAWLPDPVTNRDRYVFGITVYGH